MIDIQAGDVVVCVDEDAIVCEYPFRHGGGDVAKGQICRIKRIERHRCGHCLVAHTESGNSGLIQRFRKLVKATDDFTTQIKAIRPIKQREEA